MDFISFIEIENYYKTFKIPSEVIIVNLSELSEDKLLYNKYLDFINYIYSNKILRILENKEYLIDDRVEVSPSIKYSKYNCVGIFNNCISYEYIIGRCSIFNNLIRYYFDTYNRSNNKKIALLICKKIKKLKFKNYCYFYLMN